MSAGKQTTGVKLLLTCEHGGNEIPEAFRKYFTGAQKILNSHRGFDPGAFDLFQSLRNISDFNISNKISRLLIELNRSIHHPKLYSEFTKDLTSKEKEFLIRTIYLSYRNKAEDWIRSQIESGKEVIHLSIHTFTGELNGEVRRAGFACLYDPARTNEKKVSIKIVSEMKLSLPELKCRLNYPYKGIYDGFTTYLRHKFPEKYSGIEIEVNQNCVKDNVMNADIKGCLKKATFSVLQ